MHMPDMNTLYITHSQCLAHKYEQNKTRTTDTDYEQMNASRSFRN